MAATAHACVFVAVVVAGRIRAGSGKTPTEFFDDPPGETVGRFVLGEIGEAQSQSLVT